MLRVRDCVSEVSRLVAVGEKPGRRDLDAHPDFWLLQASLDAWRIGWRLGGAGASEVAACRFQAVRLLRPEDPQAVMFGEVLVVLKVQGGEGAS